MCVCVLLAVLHCCCSPIAWIAGCKANGDTKKKQQKRKRREWVCAAAGGRCEENRRPSKSLERVEERADGGRRGREEAITRLLKGKEREEETGTFDASVRAEIPHQLSGGGRDGGRERGTGGG